ncbi:hypothetical protein ACFODZ_01560 [Marinicella sediminis]|uniref:Uncharacterized protein n=1 Tax=Marinicella sediminis TaxID=1792834 RepID=A0ABV7J6Z7_9GAMM|nr:hypothetical protein [Marinicella sediminis]
MKQAFIIIICLTLAGISHAGDVSCQVDVLKPKMNATSLQDEVSKPAQITVAEARLRLQAEVEEEPPESSQSENDEIPAETAKKESGLGNMFDILIPAKLRNPVRQ